MKASAAGEGVVLAEIGDGMAALAAGPNQALVSQCSLVVLQDSLRKNQEEEQIKKFPKMETPLVGGRMKMSWLLPPRVREDW